MSLARAPLFLLLVLGGCDGCREGVAPTDSGAAPDARFGLLPVSPDFSRLLPEPPAGWTACHGEMEPPVSIEESERRLAELRRAPPTPRVAPLPGVTTRTAPASPPARGPTVTLARAGAPPVPIALPPSARVVFTSRSEIHAQLTVPHEWDELFGRLLRALLPEAGATLFASEHDRRNASMYTDGSWAAVVAVEGADAELDAQDRTSSAERSSSRASTARRVTGCSAAAADPSGGSLPPAP